MGKISIVVGGQYGSEAKAKAAVHIGRQSVAAGNRVIGIRSGGPNAGHTVYVGDTKYVLRHLPSCAVIPNAYLLISAGSMINLDILDREINDLNSMGMEIGGRLLIDDQAIIVTNGMIDREKGMKLGQNLGSTQTGTGMAASDRCLRLAQTFGMVMESAPYSVPSNIRHAIINHQKDVEGIACQSVSEMVNLVKHGETNHIIIEGTQGFGLSTLHGGHYPFCTSKDTTASAFASDVGIPPHHVDEVVMVIRTYPIRVGGNSGHMENEINWDIVKKRCGATEDLVEMTSVTKKIRRVGEPDWDLFKRAYVANGPTKIAIHGMDYLNWEDRGIRDKFNLSKISRCFIEKVNMQAGEDLVRMVFTGPHQDDVVDL